MRMVFATVLLQGLLLGDGWAADEAPADDANAESLFDEDANQRHCHMSWGDYRCDPVAAAVSLIYKS
jgi:hypothetical protein